MKTKTETKLIDCPEHPGKHKAIMDVWPATTAGYWQCPEGFEDYHDCMDSAAEGKSELEIETSQVDFYNPADWYGHGWYETRYYVCAGEEGCGRPIDSDIADPDVDAAEARTGYEADLWDDVR